MKPRVLCVGHAVQDFVFAVDALPTRAEKFRAVDFDTVGGGPAATAAVTVAKLGGSPLLAARLGDDHVAQIICDELGTYGVDCSLLKRFGGHRSSLSSVLLDPQGERMIVNYLDPALPTEVDWLPCELPPGTAVVLADCRWPEGAAAMFSLAQEAGVPAVLDADTPVPKDGDLLSRATHIAFSASGLRDFVGHEDHARALCEIARDTEAWCSVTLGEEGVVFTDSGKVRRLPAFAVTTKDTLGAGDVWHGAFAQGLAEAMPVEQAIRLASGAAAMKVQRFGGRRGVPTRPELDAFLSGRTDGEETA